MQSNNLNYRQLSLVRIWGKCLLTACSKIHELMEKCFFWWWIFLPFAKWRLWSKFLILKENVVLGYFFFIFQTAPTTMASKLKIVIGKTLQFWGKKPLKRVIFLSLVAAVSVKKVGSLSYFVDSILRNAKIGFFFLINSRIIATVAFKIPQIISNWNAYYKK